MAKLTRKKLVEFLEDRGDNEEVFDWLIDEFLFCLETIDRAKKDLRKRGNLVDIDKEGKLKGMNPSASLYKNNLSDLMNISRKVGFSPRDIKELKKEVTKDDLPI